MSFEIITHPLDKAALDNQQVRAFLAALEIHEARQRARAEEEATLVSAQRNERASNIRSTAWGIATILIFFLAILCMSITRQEDASVTDVGWVFCGFGALIILACTKLYTTLKIASLTPEGANAALVASAALIAGGIASRR